MHQSRSVGECQCVHQSSASGCVAESKASGSAKKPLRASVSGDLHADRIVLFPSVLDPCVCVCVR